MSQMYLTVKEECSCEFTEKHSKFIGHIKPVSSDLEAVEFIEQIRSEFWDAKHNVYAYILREGFRKRYNDDGEPKSTAGIPVLQTIEKNNLTNVVVVVTRYFGGILLGTGGLVRAYSRATKDVIEKANICKFAFCKCFIAEVEYAFQGKVCAKITENGGGIDNMDYSQNVKITFHTEENIFEKVKKDLINITASKISIIEMSEGFYEVK